MNKMYLYLQFSWYNQAAVFKICNTEESKDYSKARKENWRKVGNMKYTRHIQFIIIKIQTQCNDIEYILWYRPDSIGVCSMTEMVI